MKNYVYSKWIQMISQTVQFTICTPLLFNTSSNTSEWWYSPCNSYIQINKYDIKSVESNARTHTQQSLRGVSSDSRKLLSVKVGKGIYGLGLDHTVWFHQWKFLWRLKKSQTMKMSLSLPHCSDAGLVNFGRLGQ